VFEGYYQSELSYLRDVGRAFAEKHPAIAGMLAERGGDPDVERLLEGFAFVAARMRMRIDDALPELVEALAELLLPQLMRPWPAVTIVELRPPISSQRGEQRLSAGARLSSRKVHGTACTFRTSRPVDVLPVRIEGLRVDDASPLRPELSLRLRAEDVAVVLRKGRLVFHLHGELATTTQLYLWLSRHVQSVSVIRSS
jgi:type VI secretion system protein ImpG